MSILKLQQQVDSMQLQLDALLKINDLPVRVSVDGTEQIPVSVSDGLGGFVANKMDASTFFSNKHIEASDSFSLALAHQSATVTLTGNTKIVTIPASLTWKLGSVCWLVVYGTGFTIDYSAITEKIPIPLTSLDKAIYRIQKTATNEFSIIQLSATSYDDSDVLKDADALSPVTLANKLITESDVSGGGDMLKATYDPNTVNGDAFDMDNMAESATKKILTDLERTAISTNSLKVGVTSEISNLSEDSTPQLGGELDLNNHSVGGTPQSATGDGATTIDWKLGNFFHFQFGAFNEVFTFTAPTKAGTFILKLTQDGTGSRTATFPASVKWIEGTAPTLTTTATTGTDIITLYFDGTNYYGVEALNFS